MPGFDKDSLIFKTINIDAVSAPTDHLFLYAKDNNKLYVNNSDDEVEQIAFLSEVASISSALDTQITNLSGTYVLKSGDTITGNITFDAGSNSDISLYFNNDLVNSGYIYGGDGYIGMFNENSSVGVDITQTDGTLFGDWNVSNTLSVDGIAVSLSGHTHVADDITDTTEFGKNIIRNSLLVGGPGGRVIIYDDAIEGLTNSSVLASEILTPSRLESGNGIAIENNLGTLIISVTGAYATTVEVSGLATDLVNLDNSLTSLIVDVSSSLDNYVLKSGDTMTGDLLAPNLLAGNEFDFATLSATQLNFTTNLLGDHSYTLKADGQDYITFDYTNFERNVIVNKDLIVETLATNDDQIVTLDPGGKLQASGTTLADLTGFTPLEGTGITITPSGSDYIFSVDDYISESQVQIISGSIEQNIKLSSRRNSLEITQNGHGFNVGRVVRYDNSLSAWVLAQSNTKENAESLGIIESVTTNTFVLVTEGFIEVSDWNLTAGRVYFLSHNIAGQITTDEPEVDGSVSKPMLFTLSTNTGIVYSMRGDFITTLTFIDDSSTQSISGEKTFLSITTLNGLNKSIKRVSSDYEVELTDYTILANTDSNDVTITLPFNPTDGRYITIKKINTNNDLIIARNSKLIDDSATNVIISNNMETRNLHYLSTSNSWYLV